MAISYRIHISYLYLCLSFIEYSAPINSLKRLHSIMLSSSNGPNSKHNSQSSLLQIKTSTLLSAPMHRRSSIFQDHNSIFYSEEWNHLSRKYREKTFDWAIKCDCPTFKAFLIPVVLWQVKFRLHHIGVAATSKESGRIRMNLSDHVITLREIALE